MEDIVYYERDFTLSRGDVVILKDPSRENKLIKRVVGLPGDIVTPLGPNKEEREPLTLGEGQVWVESDHAGYGYRDSSLFGPVNTDLIEAKVARFIGRFPFLWPRDVESVIPETAVNRVKSAETIKH